jgi:hypothetical protein
MRFFGLKMKSALAFYWFIINIIQINAQSVNGSCGDPSVPYDASYRPNYKKYFDGDVIYYYCENIDFHPHRTCKEGSWSGDQPVCGMIRINICKVLFFTNI